MARIVVGNPEILEGPFPQQPAGIGIDRAQHIASLDDDPSLDDLGGGAMPMPGQDPGVGRAAEPEKSQRRPDVHFL